MNNAGRITRNKKRKNFELKEIIKFEKEKIYEIKPKERLSMKKKKKRERKKKSEKRMKNHYKNKEWKKRVGNLDNEQRYE